MYRHPSYLLFLGAADCSSKYMTFSPVIGCVLLFLIKEVFMGKKHNFMMFSAYFIFLNEYYDEFFICVKCSLKVIWRPLFEVVSLTGFSFQISMLWRSKYRTLKMENFKQAQETIFSQKQNHAHNTISIHYSSVTVSFPIQHFKNILALYLTPDLHLKNT